VSTERLLVTKVPVDFADRDGASHPKRSSSLPLRRFSVSALDRSLFNSSPQGRPRVLAPTTGVNHHAQNEAMER
jgi:hypothetical protein